ncbi:MAG: hypothetical protein KDD06_27175 [Phaeodactylibacter sp.]|nr:hypothetical protein [Phaeodactylibacter sp.]MCB9263553.1 hypothetical protein [Lewinellaceae bacterium]MCB9287570.1 hypothetical protein [Lewinellaceae bacterium]
MNKKFWMVLLLAGFFALPGFGQIFDDEPVGAEARSKIQAARVAYITERLGFTPAESEQFWALHNEFEAERDKIRSKYKPSRPIESMSDQEAEAFINRRFEMEQEILNLKRDYFQRFRQAVSPRKVALFNKADKEFRLEILKRVQERRSNNRPNRNFRN